MKRASSQIHWIATQLLNHMKIRLKAMSCRCWNNQLNKIVLVGFCSTFVLLLTILQNVQFSLFYQTPFEENEQIYLQHINDKRISDAEYFLNHYQGYNVAKQFPLNNKSYDIVISIITMSRNRIMQKPSYKPKYLTQSVYKLLLLYNNYKKTRKLTYDIGFFVCNVDHDVSSYHEAKNISKYMKVVDHYKKIYFNMEHVLEKEKSDYMFCLNTSFNDFPAKYHFVIEDDAFPLDNLFPVLHYTVFYKLSYKSLLTHKIAINETLFVKFYHPERLLGYGSLEPRRLFELFGLSCLVSTLFILICNQFNKLCYNRTIVKFWILLFLYFTFIFISIGRVNVNSFRNLFSPYLHTFSTAPSCCTPAILYPNNTIKSVIDYLNTHHCSYNYGKDSIIDQLVKVSGKSGFIVEPNVFKHIGVVSALRYSVVNSQFV